MVQLGLLRSTLVYFSPLWSHSVQFGQLGKFFSPGALFRPRAYKNRAAGQKKFSPTDLETVRLEIHWGNFFSPRCSVFLGSRPKQSSWAKKISPSGSRDSKTRDPLEKFFFSQMLCFCRLSA